MASFEQVGVSHALVVMLKMKLVVGKLGESLLRCWMIVHADNDSEEEIPQVGRKVRAMKIISKTQANASVRWKRGCVKFTRYCKFLHNTCQCHRLSVLVLQSDENQT